MGIREFPVCFLARNAPLSPHLKTLLYQQDFITVYFVADANHLLVIWSGSPGADEIVRGCEQVILCMIAKHCDAVINDTREMSGSWIDASQWGLRDWFRKLRAKGLRHFGAVCTIRPLARSSAVFLPDGAFAMSAPDVAQEFANPEEAAAWLEERRRSARKLKAITSRIRLS